MVRFLTGRWRSRRRRLLILGCGTRALAWFAWMIGALITDFTLGITRYPRWWSWWSWQWSRGAGA